MGSAFSVERAEAARDSHRAKMEKIEEHLADVDVS
jgi:hypothetical protein